MSVGEKLDVLLLQEELNRGKPNWEHLSEELHVLIQCEDTPNRARVKLARAVEEVKKLLVPAVSFSSSFFSGGGGGGEGFKNCAAYISKRGSLSHVNYQENNGHSDILPRKAEVKWSGRRMFV